MYCKAGVCSSKNFKVEHFLAPVLYHSDYEVMTIGVVITPRERMSQHARFWYLCHQRRPRLACASAQTSLGLSYSHAQDLIRLNPHKWHYADATSKFFRKRDATTSFNWHQNDIVLIVMLMRCLVLSSFANKTGHIAFHTCAAMKSYSELKHSLATMWIRDAMLTSQYGTQHCIIGMPNSQIKEIRHVANITDSVVIHF